MRFEYHRSQTPKDRGLKLRPSKCLHAYKYYQHPIFGFMHTRLQTYFPFDVQICLNGREWLARQLALRGVEFERADNCFLWLHEPQRAQLLLDEQLRTAWPATLSYILTELPLGQSQSPPAAAPGTWHGSQDIQDAPLSAHRARPPPHRRCPRHS